MTYVIETYPVYADVVLVLVKCPGRGAAAWFAKRVEDASK